MFTEEAITQFKQEVEKRYCDDDKLRQSDSGCEDAFDVAEYNLDDWNLGDFLEEIPEFAEMLEKEIREALR